MSHKSQEKNMRKLLGELGDFPLKSPQPLQGIAALSGLEHIRLHVPQIAGKEYA